MLYAGEHAGVVYEAPSGLANAGERARARHAAPRVGHVERYTLEARSPDGRRGIALGCGILETATRRDRASYALAEASAVVFDRETGATAVKESTPYDRARFAADGVRIDVAGCELHAGRARGALETGARRVAWDLTFDAHAPPLRLRGTGSRAVALPFPDVRVRGRLDVNGEAWPVTAWPGAVVHTWAPHHPLQHARAHLNGNAWDEADAADLMIEAVSTRSAPSRGLGLRRLVGEALSTAIAVRYRGVRYALDGALDLRRNRGDISARRYRFEGRGAQLEIAGELWAETDDFVGVHAENPSGAPTHLLTTQLARARVEVTLRGGAPAVYHARSAALELGIMNADHGVRMHL